MSMQPALAHCQDPHKAVVQAHLEKSPHFIKVQFLSNFQLDHDNSRLHQQSVYKGLIVTVKPEYELTSADILWLHPNVTQCRALFKGGTYQKVGSDTYDLPPMNASAGIYETQQIDQMGNEVRNTYTIVDTHLEQQWHGTVQSVYSNDTQAVVSDQCKAIATVMGADERVSTSFCNMLYKGAANFHFYNAAYKGPGLVLMSPLVGYKAVTATDHPSDVIREDEHLSDMSRQDLHSLYERCDWEGKEVVNTHAMKQFSGELSSVGNGLHYRPLNVSVSLTPIHARLTPPQLLQMTPPAEHIPDSKAAHAHTAQNMIKLPYSDAVMQQLLQLKDQFKILNMYSDGNLTLPREIVQHLS